jgi:hypothetical protein
MDFERTCTLFPLSAHTPTPRSLKNIIYVPKVTHNLLSVRQLTRDNNVFVDFHLYDVFVKGRDSREIILSGRSWCGRYPITTPPVQQDFSSVHVSSAKCPCHLGHPVSPVVQHVLQRHAFPTDSSNKSIFVYDACQQRKSHHFNFSLSIHVIKTRLELIYYNVWGPAQTSISIIIIMWVLLMPIVVLLWLYLLKH